MGGWAGSCRILKKDEGCGGESRTNQRESEFPVAYVPVAGDPEQPSVELGGMIDRPAIVVGVPVYEASAGGHRRVVDLLERLRSRIAGFVTCGRTYHFQVE